MFKSKLLFTALLTLFSTFLFLTLSIKTSSAQSSCEANIRIDGANSGNNPTTWMVGQDIYFQGWKRFCASPQGKDVNGRVDLWLCKTDDLSDCIRSGLPNTPTFDGAIIFDRPWDEANIEAYTGCGAGRRPNNYGWQKSLSVKPEAVYYNRSGNNPITITPGEYYLKAIAIADSPSTNCRGIATARITLNAAPVSASTPTNTPSPTSTPVPTGISRYATYYQVAYWDWSTSDYPRSETEWDAKKDDGSDLYPKLPYTQNVKVAHTFPDTFGPKNIHVRFIYNRGDPDVRRLTVIYIPIDTPTPSPTVVPLVSPTPTPTSSPTSVTPTLTSIPPTSTPTVSPTKTVTQIPTDTPRSLTHYQVAYDTPPSNWDAKNADNSDIYPRKSYAQNVKETHTFSPDSGPKNIFVRFIYNTGTPLMIEHQLTVVYAPITTSPSVNPSPTTVVPSSTLAPTSGPTSTPTNTPSPTTPIPTQTPTSTPTNTPTSTPTRSLTVEPKTLGFEGSVTISWNGIVGPNETDMLWLGGGLGSIESNGLVYQVIFANSCSHIQGTVRPASSGSCRLTLRDGITGGVYKIYYRQVGTLIDENVFDTITFGGISTPTPTITQTPTPSSVSTSTQSSTTNIFSTVISAVTNLINNIFGK